MKKTEFYEVPRLRDVPKDCDECERGQVAGMCVVALVVGVCWFGIGTFVGWVIWG